MFCHKCGTEISSENANFCINCKEPLIKIPESVRVDGKSGVPQTKNADFDGMPSSVSIDFGDDDEALRISDPIDFLMNEEQTDQSALPEIKHEKPEFETATDKNIEQQNDKKPDLIAIEGNSGSEMAVDDFKNESAGKNDMPEQKQEKEIPPLLTNFVKDDPNDGENIRATSKIKLDNISKLNKPKPKAESSTTNVKNAKSVSNSTNLDIKKIKQSNGVVYLSGNSFTFAGGTRILPGDCVQVGDKSFEVKSKPKNNTNLYGMIGSVAAAILITLFYLGAFNGAPDGSLVGIVIGGPDDRPLSDQEVRLLEINKTVKTNNAGFFIFNNVPTGIYTVEYIQDERKIGEERITVLGDKVSTIKLSESEPEPVSNIKQAPIKTRPAQTAINPIKSETRKTPKKNDPGILKLSLKPSGVRAYLDGKPLGVGTKTYRVRPGKYILSLKKKGHKTQSKKITVKSEKKLSYSFNLKKSNKASKKKTNGEIAYKNETDGNYDEALRYYDKMLIKNNRDLSALLGKARCYKAQNLTDKAITNYMRAANIASEKGNYDSQYDALTGIIEARPNTFTAYNSRGDLLYSMGDYDRAAKDFRKIIELDRRNLKTYYKLGVSYFKGEKYSDAIAAFRAAEELHFADPKAQVFLAKTYFAMNDKKNAKKSYEKFKELANYSTELEYNNDPEWKKVLTFLNVNN